MPVLALHRRMIYGVHRNALLLICSAVLFSIVGCGGGGGSSDGSGGAGGGGGGVTFPARSYYASAGGRVFALTLDPTGRFTAVAQDATSLPAPACAQGLVTSQGLLSAPSADGRVRFSGTLSSRGDTLTCSVIQGNGTLFTVETAAVAASGNTAALAGTYISADPTDPVFITVDKTGHATLYVETPIGNWSGLVNVASDGALASYSGDFEGRLDLQRPDPQLIITRINGSSSNTSLDLRSAARAKWTFMVFLNAANDLQPYGSLNVNQMEKVGSTASVNIVVQWKQANCSSCGTPSWVSTRRYYITQDNDPNRVTSPLLEDLGPNIDMGDWRTLYGFITWVQRKYPAERYALVIWNHGAGWRNTRAGIPGMLRSVSIDDSTGSEIATWELPQALNVTPKVDLLIFDASLMQMVEVAYEVRNAASIMVGSQESPPGEGYVYDAFLVDLVREPTMEPAAFARSIVERTLESYGVNSNITQSAVDLSKMQFVADRMDAFARLLILYAPTYASELAAARQDTESYQYRDNKDLWHYAEQVRIRNVPNDVKTAAVNLQQAIETAVIAEAHGRYHPNSHGLAVYIPEPASYLSSYALLALSRVTQWDEWLRAQPAR